MGEILVKLMESPVAPLILLGLFWLGYQSLKKQINGLGARTRTQNKEHDERLRSIDMALLLVAKNDPERRQIVDVLEKKANVAEILDKPPAGPGSN
jgi:hypothetical protein